MTPRYRLYGFEACPYCQKAKRLLAGEGIGYEEIAIEDPEARRAFLDARGIQGAGRTFPRIWALDAQGEETRLVGGASDLEMEILLGPAG